MKTYLITLLTLSGVKTEVYNDDEVLSDFEARMIVKHKTFTMLFSEDVTHLANQAIQQK